MSSNDITEDTSVTTITKADTSGQEKPNKLDKTSPHNKTKYTRDRPIIKPNNVVNDDTVGISQDLTSERLKSTIISQSQPLLNSDVETGGSLNINSDNGACNSRNNNHKAREQRGVPVRRTRTESAVNRASTQYPIMFPYHIFTQVLPSAQVTMTC